MGDQGVKKDAEKRPPRTTEGGLSKECKRLKEENRLLQEKCRLEDLLTAEISHEMRAPLHGVIAIAELMRDRVFPVEVRKGYLDDILASATHLLCLIENLSAKATSVPIPLHPEPVDLAKLVTEVTRLMGPLALQGKICLKTEIDVVLADVVTDRMKLTQVLYNFLSNAIKFTPQGGDVSVRFLPEGAALFRLEVEDTGIGIAASDYARLFVPFERLHAGGKYPGSGLGLSITKRIVEAQGGEVGVRGAPKGGSIFFAVFPRRLAISS